MDHLPDDVHEAMHRVVTYFWDDEHEDYYTNCSDDPADNQRAGHIFESLKTINDFLSNPGRRQ